MILSKNQIFYYRCFSLKLCQKRSFFDIYEQNNDFKWKKLKFEKGPENGHFPKGLVHGFCPKIELSLFPVFHGNYVTKNLF